MILRMSDYPRTLLEFQHFSPNETASTRHLERIRSQPDALSGLSQRVRVPIQAAILADGGCGIRPACANRIGIVFSMPIRLTQVAGWCFGLWASACQITLGLSWSFNILSLMRRPTPAIWSVSGSSTRVEALTYRGFYEDM